MRKLGLYGAGDLGSEVFEMYGNCSNDGGPYDEVFFIDDGDIDIAPGNARIIDFEELLSETADHDVSVAICIGEPQARKAVLERLVASSIKLATLVHNDARVSRNAEIGVGCIIDGGSRIGPNSTIGCNSIVLSSYVSHNCTIGQCSVLDANATLSCHVYVGDYTYLSVGAMVREGVRVGSRAIIGMGAAVFLDVDDDLYVAGNPARPLRRNEDQKVFRMSNTNDYRK